jgi:hypothetical protein
LDSTKETADGGTARESAELLVTLEPGTDPTEFARAHHLTWVRTLKSDPNMHVLAAASASEARKTISSIFRDSRVRRAELNLPSQNQPFSPQ